MSNFFKKKSGAAIPRFLCVQIESGHKVWYQINGIDGVIEHITAENFSPNSPYLSLINDDYRRKATESLSNSAATSLVARSVETMDKIVVINQSKQGWVYGTTASRLDNEDPLASPIPLMTVVDALIAQQNIAGPAVIGVIFEKDGLSLLFAVEDAKQKHEDTKTRYQISINNENLESSAISFASMMNLPEDVPMHFFSKDQLFKSTRAFPSYPIGSGLSTSSIGKYLPILAAVSVVGAAGLWGYVYFQQAQIENVNDQISIEHAKEASANKDIASVIEDNPTGFIKTVSLDINKAFAEAEALWIAGSKFESELSTATRVHTVSLNYRNNRTKTLNDINDQEKFETALTRLAPEGCRLTGITFAGNMNEIKSKYACTNSPNTLARFGF